MFTSTHKDPSKRISKIYFGCMTNLPNEQWYCLSTNIEIWKNCRIKEFCKFAEEFRITLH